MKKSGGVTKYFLPIIPDLNVLITGETARTADSVKYDIPKLPEYDPERLFAMRPIMKKRFG